MSRCIVVNLVLAVSSAGCVPVTDPVGDINKAEPNQALIGSWRDNEQAPRLWVVDHPEVKGNPKGLVRLRVLERGQKLEDVKSKDSLWFFTANAGEHTYANLLVLANTPKKVEWEPDFTRPGQYDEWTKHPQSGYFVARLAVKGPVVTLDYGNSDAFKALMNKQNFMEIGEFYKTTPGWLTTYLEKNSPTGIFNSGKGTQTLTRVDGKK
jgi:hypothetical protein